MANPQLFNRRAKWWQVEIRFSRQLTDREVRTLSAALYGVAEHEMGQDGALIGQWPTKWPGADDDRVVLDAIRKVGVPAKVRAAPHGRDCPGAGCDLLAISDKPPAVCAVGDIASCDAVLTDEDWLVVDPAAERASP